MAFTKRYIRNMNMLDVVTSSFTDPYGTMEHLLVERETPPYIVSSLVAIIVVIVIPSIMYQYWYDITPPMPEVTYSVITTLAITLLFFVLFAVIMLRMIGISAPVIKILAATIYSLTPAVPMMIGYYIGNYVAIGKVSVLTFFVTGQRAHGDWFLAFLPYFVKATVFFTFLVFSQAMRVIGKMGIITGFLTAISAFPLVLGAFWAGITCAEALFPETAVLVIKFIAGFLVVPNAS
jgi:hypothetical protein